MTLALMAAYAFGVLAPFIIEGLHISTAQYALLPAAYYLAAVAGSGWIGGLADRTDSATTLTGLFAVVGVAFVGLALAPVYVLALVPAALAGVAVASSNPVTNRVVVERFPAASRAAIMGWKQAGVPAGALVVGAVLPTLALHLGWRWALAAAAVVPLALVPVTLAVLGRPTRPRPPAPHATRRRPDTTVWTLAVFALLMAVGTSFFNSFLALYAVHALGVSRSVAGLVVAFSGLAGILSRVVWASAGGRRRPSGLLVLLAGGALVFVLFLAAAPRIGVWALWVGAAGIGMTAISWQGLGMLAVVEAVPAASMGWASAFVMRTFYAAMFVAPIAYGQLIDRTGGFASSFGLQAVVYALALLVVVRWARSERRAVEPAVS